MSLINDALKRARQAQQKNETPAGGAPLQPVEARRRVTHKSALLPLTLAAVLVVVGGILIIIAMTNGAPRKTQLSNSDTTVPAVVASMKAEALATNISSAGAPTPVPPVSAIATNALAVTGEPAESATPTQELNTTSVETNAPPVSIAATTVPPAPMLPKLQGIFFNPSRPSAVLNGKTVFIGSKVGDFSVVAITQQTVSVTRGGETNVLSLEE